MVEKVCLWLAGIALLVLVALVCAEVVARSVFHFSFEFVEEVGGYLLATLSFCALAPALAAGSFHRVEFIQQRMSATARRIAEMMFLSLALVFTLVMTWFLTRFVWRSYAQQDVAPTALQTPLWIPELSMTIGMGAMAITLAAALVAQARRKNHQ